jgi:hypothetical protein
MLRVMLRGADSEELLGVIRHAYGTATPIERLYSIPQLPQSATEPVMPCTPSTNVALLGTDTVFSFIMGYSSNIWQTNLQKKKD